MTRGTDRAVLSSAIRDGHGDHNNRDRYQEHTCVRAGWLSGGARSSVITVATHRRLSSALFVHIRIRTQEVRSVSDPSALGQGTQEAPRQALPSECMLAQRATHDMQGVW